MTDEQRSDFPEEPEPEESSRPAPRNPFEQHDPEGEEAIPALINDRRTAAISGVVVGLIALLLVVGLCVASSYAFSS